MQFGVAVARRHGAWECVQVKWQPNDVLASLAQVLTNLAVDPSFAKVCLLRPTDPPPGSRPFIAPAVQNPLALCSHRAAHNCTASAQIPLNIT